MNRFFLTAALVFTVAAFPVAAQTTITNEGEIRISGEIVSTGLNEFTIAKEDDSQIDVTLDSLDDSTLQGLTTTGIIKKGNYVEVVGMIDESATGTTIEAQKINIFSGKDIQEAGY